jgi:hypothetical protein
MAVSAPSTQLPRRSPIWLIAVVVGLTLLAGCGQATTTHDTPGVVAPAVPRAAVAVAPADLKVALLAWLTGGGPDHVPAIIKDVQEMVAADAAPDIPGMNAACRSLQTDVEAAQAYNASVPDTMLQNDWSSALAQEARAATDCTAATRNGNLDSDLLNQSNREFDAATATWSKYNARLNALVG